ncbi:hypothetical protein VTH82DRAFT_1219 [Thermothelomyces myriococcoides]
MNIVRAPAIFKHTMSSGEGGLEILQSMAVSGPPQRRRGMALIASCTMERRASWSTDEFQLLELGAQGGVLQEPGGAGGAYPVSSTQAI